MSLDPRHDPDLDFLQDGELLDIAAVLRRRRPAAPPLDPAFQSSLRRQLRRQHYELLEVSPPWWRRLGSGPALAWTGAAVGVLLIAAAVLFAIHPGGTSNTALVTSPLDHMRDVAVVQPMKIQFAQAMDHQSVQSALKIEPATQVNYVWQGNTLLVQPAAGQLAPNTQYRLTLGSSASSSDGTPLGRPTTIVFVTAPPATPAPVVSPTPAPAGIALGTPAQVAPGLSGVAPAWSPDSKTIYLAAPDDTLQSVPAAGGSPRSLGVQSVSGIAVSPDGATVAATSSSSVYTVSADGSGVTTVMPEAGALALAWDQDRLLAALATGVVEVRKSPGPPHTLVQFASPAQAAAFAPDGKRVLYLDGGGQVHLVDIDAGKDSAWQTSAAGLPVWSQDGHQVAFLTAQGVQLAQPDGSGASALATLDQLGVHTTDGIQLAWSDGAVLAATPAGLTGIDTTLHVPVQLATAAVSGLAPSPDHRSVAYVQGGEVLLAPLTRPGVQKQLLAKADAVLQPFMAARQAGDAATAGRYLDSSGQQAYAKGTLVFNGEPHLARWFPVFVQAHPDGTIVALVRLVLADQKNVEQSQLDETITLQSGADGTVVVHDVTPGSPRSVDGGPEVLSVQLSGTQLQLQFDSDLDPASLDGISVAGPDGNPLQLTPSYDRRTVTIDLSSVPAGSLLQLSISTSLKDVAGRGTAQPLVIPILLAASAA